MIQSVWKNLTGLQKAAEHLWWTFKWATTHHQTLMTCFIHYMHKSISTPSLEEKKALPKKAKHITLMYFKNGISTSFATVLKGLK